MTIAWILLAVAVVVVGLLAWFARGQRLAIRSMEDIQSHIVPVDVDALLNLFDPREDAFLKRRLPARQYNSLRRERCRVGGEYVRRIAANSAVLLRANYFARLQAGADEAKAAQAAEMISIAIRTRTAALNVLVLLYLGTIFPSLGDPIQLGNQYKLVLGRTLSFFQNEALLSA